MLAPILFVAVQASAALERYAAWAKATPAFRVDVTTSVPGSPTAKGSLMVQRSGRLLYQARWGVSDFSLSATERGYLEIERARRLYDERPPTGRLGQMPSRVSRTPDLTLPGFLLLSDLRGLAPGGTEFRSAQSPEGDVAIVRVQSRSGWIEMRATIDARGRLVRFSQGLVDPTKPNDPAPRPRVWSFSGYAPLSNPPLARFRTSIPAGYLPYALPIDPMPLQKGAAFPIRGWVDRAGRPARLKPGGPTLVALLGEGSAPSARSRASLRRLAPKLSVLELSDARKPPRRAGAYYDPSGGSLRTLGAPGTPLFFLVGADGKVRKLWLGYDPRRAKGFEADVLASAKAG